MLRVNRFNRSFVVGILMLTVLTSTACVSESTSDVKSDTPDNHVLHDGPRVEISNAGRTPDPIQEIFVKGRKPRGKLGLPTVVNAEDRFSNPPEIPDKIFQFVQSISTLNPDCRESTQTVNECFAIVQVDLNEDSFSDFVLFGRGRNGGANVASFYVLAGTQSDFKVVLEDVKLQLEITERKTKGYFDITTFAATASIGFTNYYSFDGTKYKIRRKTQENL